MSATDLAAKRKSFQKQLMRPAPSRGFVVCRLCKETTWGPNGRYHIDKCPIIVSARAEASRNNIKLASIGNMMIDEDLFSSPCLPRPKPAKLEGFVMSSSALLDDPTAAPLPGEPKHEQKTGRKGYTRCLKCNKEIFAPNTKRHICRRPLHHREGKNTRDILLRDGLVRHKKR